VAATRQPVFYYDLGHPECYLAAERINAALGIVPEWEPVSAAALGWVAPIPDAKRLSAAIDAQGLQPLRLPTRWPPDTEMAMRTATFAKRAGRAVAYSLAAFRQAFAGGRDLADEGTVLLAAAACELHPAAVLKGVGMRSVAEALQRAGQRALESGATALPAIQLGALVFCGPDAVERAAAAAVSR
jgi:2-hydroxychromene-2-carboxylate isomerase